MKPLRTRHAVLITAAVFTVFWCAATTLVIGFFSRQGERDMKMATELERQRDAGAGAIESGRYDAAERCLQGALEFAESAYGEDNSYVASTAHSLACLYRRQGKREQARPLFERCLSIHERLDGPESLHLTAALGHLSALCLELGDIDASLAHAERDLDIQEREFGIGDPRLSGSLKNVAAALERQGKHAAALPFRERIVVLEGERYHNRSFEFARALYQQAEILRIQGEYALAEPVYRQSLNLLETQDTPWAIRLKERAALGCIEVLRGLGRSDETDALEAKTMRMQSEELPGE